MKESALTTKRLSIVPTAKCTLNCKLCSNHMPIFKNPPSASYEDMISDIDVLFKLFDNIEWLQFVGGEVFIHKDMANVYNYCQKYKSQFSKLIIETNATVALREEEIDIFVKYGENIKIMISDYGVLSTKKEQYIETFEKNNIPYIIKKYFGDNQHFGGWIDNTALKDYGESDEEVERLVKECAQVRLENMHCFKGKLHRCCNSLFMTELGVIEPNDDDFVNLHDSTLSFEEKRRIIKTFYKHSGKSCRFCAWKNSSIAERFSAAKQIER